MHVRKHMEWLGLRKPVPCLFSVSNVILIKPQVHVYVHRCHSGRGWYVNGGEDACILCRLCLTPVSWMLVIDEEKKAVQKCTLCLDAEDQILPACVEACKDNVLKIFSVEDLEDLKKDLSYTEVLNEAMKAYQKKI